MTQPEPVGWDSRQSKAPGSLLVSCAGPRSLWDRSFDPGLKGVLGSWLQEKVACPRKEPRSTLSNMDYDMGSSKTLQHMVMYGALEPLCQPTGPGSSAGRRYTKEEGEVLV